MFRRCLLAAAVVLGTTVLLPAGSAHAVNGVPGKVSALRATTSLSTESLRWKAPAHIGDSAITGYQVTGDLGTHTVTEPKISAHHSLEVGTERTVTVRAQNSNGVGPPVTLTYLIRPSGYWLINEIGEVSAFGQVENHTSGVTFDKTYVDIEPSSDGDHYWRLTSDGVVDPEGPKQESEDNPHPIKKFGDVQGRLTSGETAVSISALPDDTGYWVFTSRGRVFAFGAAKTYGGLGTTGLNQPVINSVGTPTGKGYYMVALDGGVFAFGDARFVGSMGSTPLNAPVRAIVPDADNDGYWLVASDGGVFSFNAAFQGSMGGKPLNGPIIGMVRFGSGYLMVASDGGVFNFSTKPFFGSRGSGPSGSPFVSIAASS